MDVRAIVDCKTSLGEGPIWDVQDQKAYWIDSLGNKVFRANQDGSGVEAWDVPSKIGSLAIRNDGGAILSLQNGFHAFSFEAGKGTLLLDPEPALDGNRLNDGKVDRKGRFVCGSMHMKETDKTASLYRLDPDLSLHKLEDDIIVSNGPRWSPDDKLSISLIPGPWKFPPTIGTQCPGPLQISGRLYAMMRRGARTAFQMERLSTLKDIYAALRFFLANCAVSRQTERLIGLCRFLSET